MTLSLDFEYWRETASFCLYVCIAKHWNEQLAYQSKARFW